MTPGRWAVADSEGDVVGGGNTAGAILEKSPGRAACPTIGAGRIVVMLRQKHR